MTRERSPCAWAIPVERPDPAPRSIGGAGALSTRRGDPTEGGEPGPPMGANDLTSLLVVLDPLFDPDLREALDWPCSGLSRLMGRPGLARARSHGNWRTGSPGGSSTPARCIAP